MFRQRAGKPGRAGNSIERRGRSMAAFRTRAGAVLVAVTMSGCGAHFYDAERNKLSSDIAENSSALEAGEIFAVAQRNLDTMLTHEISVRDRHIKNVRDLRLWDAINNDRSVNGLVRLDFKNGRPGDQIKRLNALGITNRAELDRIAEVHRRLNAIIRPEVTSSYKQMKALCADPEVTSAVCAKFRSLGTTDKPGIDELCDISGLIGNACGEWRSARARIETIKAERDAIAAALKTGADDGGTEAPDLEIASLQEKADDAAEYVADAADLLEGLGVDAGLTAARVSALEALLGAFASGDAEQDALENASPGLKKAAVVAAKVPGLTAEIVALSQLRNQREPRTAVALELTKQRLRLSFLGGRIELLEEEERNNLDALKALVREAFLIHSADVHARQAGGFANRTIANVVATKARSPSRVAAMRALIAHDQSFSVARRDYDRARYRVLDGKHRQALLSDRYASELWASVIKAPIAQLAAYHAGGVRPEALIDLITKIGGVIQLGRID